MPGATGVICAPTPAVVQEMREELSRTTQDDNGEGRSDAMRRCCLALAVLLDLLVPLGAWTHQAGCHWIHSCPSDRSNYVCGDLGHCDECPDNPFCQAGHPRQDVRLPLVPAPPGEPPTPATDALTPPVPTQETAITGTTVAIVNGVTLAVVSQGTPVRVRLSGIAVPERYQVFGKRAKRYLSTLALQHEVTVTVRDTDREGRVVGEVCLADGRNLSQELVHAGLAWHEAQDAPHDPVLRRLQAEAQTARRGLGRDPHPALPWALRRERAR